MDIHLPPGVTRNRFESIKKTFFVYKGIDIILTSEWDFPYTETEFAVVHPHKDEPIEVESLEEAVLVIDKS